MIVFHFLHMSMSLNRTYSTYMVRKRSFNLKTVDFKNQRLISSYASCDYDVSQSDVGIRSWPQVPPPAFTLINTSVNNKLILIYYLGHSSCYVDIFRKTLIYMSYNSQQAAKWLIVLCHMFINRSPHARGFCSLWINHYFCDLPDLSR